MTKSKSKVSEEQLREEIRKLAKIIFVKRKLKEIFIGIIGLLIVFYVPLWVGKFIVSFSDETIEGGEIFIVWILGFIASVLIVLVGFGLFLSIKGWLDSNWFSARYDAEKKIKQKYGIK